MKFQEHIGPYALQLLHNFWEVFTRIITQEEENITGLAALECLRAILVVLTSIQERPDLYPEAEKIIFPTLKQSFGSGTMEYFEDFSRILSCFACYSNSISDDLWEFVPILYQEFETWALDYLPSILVSVDNIVTADREGFVKRNYFALLFQMYQKSLDMGPNELLEPVQIAACQLIELAIQNCLGSGDAYMEGIISVAMERMDKDFFGVALPTVIFNVFGNIFYYNPLLALSVLEKNKWTQSLFTQWFTFFEHFQRIYDRKVTVLGLSSIFLLPPSQWPAVIQNSVQNIFTTCLRLLSDCAKLRAEKEKNATEEAKITFADEARVNTLREAAAHANPEQMGLSNFDEDLRNEYEISAAEASFEEWLDQDPNALEDEDEVTTAIDPVNETAFFFHTIQVLQQNDSALFARICGSLTQDERNLMSFLNDIAKQ
eukprot:CAMPEP_0117020128 /NCGR_PEP_ID=MMETSP0472-20121206/15340_1 /TAXON_ID=693140 ORGANISM="Tiarina fusus, Strain LIS" /NCGR_SAMPLE_ID=MMETSP0472 /ASSEMBLY_ACC=CAM_ASM_000603 /LENGTH=431 /DNA_ID=CAMNT_0004725251 /DNA_START=1720 /DNA_END=3015 /DNA_ORIENTATION=+